MNKEFSTERFKKMISVVNVISQILYLGALVFIGFFIIAGIVVLFIDQDLFTIKETSELITYNLDFNSIIQITNEQVIEEGTNLKPIVLTIFFSIPFILGIFALVFRFLSKLLKSIKETTPFTYENVKRLQIIAWIIIGSSFIIPLVEVINFNVIIYTLGIEKISTEYSMDLGTIFVGALLLILAQVFKYGTYLQQEYDQTL